MTFSGPGTFEEINAIKKEGDRYWGAGGVGAQLWGDKAIIESPAAAGNIVMATVNLTIPDGCTVGDQAWVDFPAGFHVRGAGMADLTDASGTPIAKVSLDVRPGLEHYSTRMVFTFTDGVDTSRNITGTYSFQYQEGMDVGIKANSDVDASMTGSDGSVFNEIKWHFVGDKWYVPYNSGSWSGSATNPNGASEVRSAPSYTGSEDVDLTMTAGPGYDWNCDALSNQDNSKNTGIGLADVGNTPNSMPTAINLLDPSKYTLECNDSTVHVRMPASSWTSADAATGQVLVVRVWRRGNGDDSWQPNGGVYGFTTMTMGDKTILDNSRWFNPAPGSSGSGSGIELTTIDAIPAPTLTTNPQCGKRPTVTTTAAEGVTWKTSLSADGNTATVTARAKAGYYIPASVKSSWTLTIPEAIPCPVDATWSKTWDAATMTWTLTVSNPSSEADTKPVTLTDAVTITDASGKVTQVAGEAITSPSTGTVNGASWSVGALKPGQTATAKVKADWKWLAGNGGTVTNHLGKQGDGACATASKASATCAISTVKVDVDPTVNKTWDDKTQTWTLTVTNPAKDRPSRATTFTDNVTVKDANSKTIDVTGETITGATVGTVDGDTWSVPALKPGQSVTAKVKAKSEWTAGNGGTLVNHFAATGSTCLTNPDAKDSASCAITQSLIPVDATWVKTWDEKAKAWTLTVSNPAKDRPTRPITLVDSTTILDADDNTTDVKDEVITNPSLGTVDGDTWTLPALPAGGKATATVKAKDEWLAGNGGSVINRLAKTGDKKCPAATAASAHCAISTVAVDVDPVITKTWDEDTRAWTVTVSNPSEEVQARSILVRDNLSLKGKDGVFSDLEGEELSNPTGGTVDGATWTTPTLQPGETASVLLKAKDEWLTGTGELVNRAGMDGVQCVADPASEVGTCAETITAQTPAPEAAGEAAPVLAKTGVGLGLAALAGVFTLAGTMVLGARKMRA